jgi:hypothetical protein
MISNSQLKMSRKRGRKMLQRPACALVLMILLQSCGGDSGTTPTTPTTPSTPTLVATSVALSATSVTLALGTTSQLSATVKDQNGATMADKAITWGASDAAIVSVSSSGLVTAVSPGTANITATHLTLSATASVVTEDATFPEVLAFAVDTTGMSGGAMNNAETGILEFYGTIKLEAIVADNHKLKSIAFVYGDSLLYEADLTGDSAYVSFDWNTRETSKVGGLADDTLGVAVIDMSDNIGLGLISAASSGKDGGLVLMHQPSVVVNNLLTRPVTATFESKDGGIAYSINTVAAQGSSSLTAHVLSTDSVRLYWEIQREGHPYGSGYYLGQEFGARFAQKAADVDLTWEIDNVIGGGVTYYTPHWSNAESNTSEAYPIIDYNITGEINICKIGYYYSCSIAPGAQNNEYGYYELSTTSRPGYQKKISSSVGTDWCSWAYSGFIDSVADGSGRVNFNVFTGVCAEGAGSPSRGVEAGSDALIQPSSGPNPRRIPGAIHDDEPSPFGLNSGVTVPIGPGWTLN